MDIVIIGNGIIALSTAYRLAMKTQNKGKITIIGKKSRPGSATLAAAAMLNSFCEIEEGGLESEMDMFRFEMSHLATRMWPRFVKEYMEVAGTYLPEGCSQCQGSSGACYELGTYLINNAAADDLDDINFKAIVKALKDFDEPYMEVNPGDIPNYNPEKRHRALRAIYIPNEGWLNPILTLEALESALYRFDHVQFIDDEVKNIIKVGNQIDHVVLQKGGMLSGDKFLLASGATVTDILEKSNLELRIPRIFYGVGVSILMKNPEFPHTKCIRTPNRGLACGLYTVPFYESPKIPNNKILVGATNLISPVPLGQPRVVNVEGLLKGAMEQININFYKSEIERVNLGWRPTSADTYPLIGQTKINNLIIASGTKRDGFHLAPLLSEVLVSIIYNEQIDSRYEWFKPERDLIRSLTREQAIQKAIKHLMSASYQHGFIPAHNRMVDQLKQSHRNDLENLHDQVGAYDWGIPPELIDMYRYDHIK